MRTALVFILAFTTALAGKHYLIETGKTGTDYQDEGPTSLNKIDTVQQEGPCDQPKGVKRLCDKDIPAWTFDKATKICEKFSMGGCEEKGNENRFPSKYWCEKTCVSSSEQEGLFREGCDQPKGVKRQCDENIPAWTFDKVTNVCEKFSMGGCEETENKFTSKSLCENQCVYSSEQGKTGTDSQDEGPTSGNKIEGNDTVQQDREDIEIVGDVGKETGREALDGAGEPGQDYSGGYGGHGGTHGGYDGYGRRRRNKKRA